MNAQFEHINATAEDFLQRGDPVISVDTKKKELVGNFKNGGKEWQLSRTASTDRISSPEVIGGLGGPRDRDQGDRRE